MILKILLRAETNIVLPKSYNHLLQSFFYRNMDPILSKFLHDIGFVYGKRRFKLFTFSKIIGNMVKKDRKKGLVYFEPNITLYFASPLMDLISSSVKTFLKKENLFIGKNKLHLEAIEVIKPNIDEEITVRCLSPITVYRTPLEGNRKFIYKSPWQEEFYELIKNNLIKKYELVYGKNFKGEIEIKPVKIDKKYKKKIIYKGTLIEAWEGYYKLSGNKEIIVLALEAGLGAKNSAGFGMVERVL